AEVPETLASACELFIAGGYVQEGLLIDYVLQPEHPDVLEGLVNGRLIIPVTVDDLAANGLLETHPRACWERAAATLTARKDEIEGLAVASDERIEAYVLYRTSPAEIVSFRSSIDDGGTALKRLLGHLLARAVGTLRFPRVHPEEFSRELMETLGFTADG